MRLWGKSRARTGVRTASDRCRSQAQVFSCAGIIRWPPHTFLLYSLLATGDLLHASMARGHELGLVTSPQSPMFILFHESRQTDDTTPCHLPPRGPPGLAWRRRLRGRSSSGVSAALGVPEPSRTIRSKIEHRIADGSPMPKHSAAARRPWLCRACLCPEAGVHDRRFLPRPIRRRRAGLGRRRPRRLYGDDQRPAARKASDAGLADGSRHGSSEAADAGRRRQQLADLFARWPVAGVCQRPRRRREPVRAALDGGEAKALTHLSNT